MERVTIDDSQAASIDVKNAAEKAAENRPAWLPEKFKTPEDMAKSYVELEKKLGTTKPEEKPAETKPATKPEEKLAAPTAEQLAAATKMADVLTETAGGKDGLKAIYTWAKANLTPEEVEGYDAVVGTGNAAAARLALQSIVARFTEATGQEPALLGGERTPGQSGVQPFASQGEVIEAMKDKRYANDAAYRQEVEKRMEQTHFFALYGGKKMGHFS